MSFPNLSHPVLLALNPNMRFIFRTIEISLAWGTKTVLLTKVRGTLLARVYNLKSGVRMLCLLCINVIYILPQAFDVRVDIVDSRNVS